MSLLLVLLPIALVCWFLPFQFAAVLSRALLLLSVSGGLTKTRLLRPVEARWILLFGLFLAASAASALFSMDPSASLVDFGRQAYVAVFSILLVLATRGSSARARLAGAIIFPTLLGMAAVLYLFWKFGSGFSNDALHAFKGSVSASAPTLSINPIAGFVVLTFFLSVPVFSRFKHVTWILAAIFALVLLLTGARSTIVALPLALLLFWIIRFFSDRAAFATQLAGLVLLGALTFALMANVRMPATTVDDLDDVTTHRVYLWEAALEQFANHPWFGAGADTWRLDLATTEVPAQSPEISDTFSRLSSGAYHNAYLAFLAERGLIVFIPALLILWFVLRSAFRVYTYRKLFAPGDREFANLAPIMVLFILARQLAECSGLLGYANGAVDFASFAVASLVVALAANIEHVVSPAYEQQRVVTLAKMVNWQ